jgi:hypothetical protein
MLIAQWKSGVKPFHVFNCVDGYAAFANFAKNAIRVAVQPVKRRTIKSRAEPQAVLMLREIMESPIGVLGEAQTGKKAGWLFGFAICDLRFAI